MTPAPDLEAVCGGPSREWLIDRQINALIGKMVSGGLTDRERFEFDRLTGERARLMRPKLRNHLRNGKEG